MTLTEFLLARIAEREAAARALLRDLEGQIETEGFAADERGPFTPARMLAAQLWAHYDGQTRWRNFARGQHIATLSDPARVLAECEAKRWVIELAQQAMDEAAEHGHDKQVGAVFEGRASLAEAMLRAEATAYADHEEYLPEWKP